MQKSVQEVLRVAQLLRDRLRAVGIPAFTNQYSNICIFPDPEDPVFVRRWQIATSNGVAHVVVMMSTRQQVVLETFVNQLCTLFAKRTRTGKPLRPLVNVADEEQLRMITTSSWLRALAPPGDSTQPPLEPPLEPRLPAEEEASGSKRAT